MMMMVSISDRHMAKCLRYHAFLLTVILGFEHESYSISEGNGSVEVCVQVSGILQSSLHLSFTTVDGDATGEQG